MEQSTKAIKDMWEQIKELISLPYEDMQGNKGA
jgi:hypothetical protein